jgi:hypothetical protein
METEAATRTSDDEYDITGTDAFAQLACCQVDHRIATLDVAGSLVDWPDNSPREFGSKAHFHRNQAIDGISNDFGHTLSPSHCVCSPTSIVHKDSYDTQHNTLLDVVNKEGV